MAGSANDLDVFLGLRRELVNYANGITGDRMQAEDVVQEAYIRLIAGRGEPIEQPVAYAYRVVRNLALDLPPASAPGVHRGARRAGRQS